MTLFLAIVLAIVTLVAAALIWRLYTQLEQQIDSRHAVRPSRTSLVTTAEAAAHADAMHGISARFIPKVQAGNAPWETPEGAAAEALQQERFAYARNELEKVRRDATTGAMRAILAGMPGRVYGQTCVANVQAAEQQELAS